MSDIPQAPQITPPPSDPSRQAAHCPLCGAKNLRGFNFCQACGQPLPWSQVQPINPPAVAPTPPPEPAIAPNPIQQTKDEPAGLALKLISFFFPFVGFIVWVGLLCSLQRRKAAQIGWVLLAGIVFVFVVYRVFATTFSPPSVSTLIPTPTTTPDEPYTPSISQLQPELTPSYSQPSSDESDLTATTPAASTPTRVVSDKPLDGERFPQTRMYDMDASEVSQMGDDDLRYAINEMYARYGMTFKSKKYQDNFNGLTWYHPVERWTPEQIEKVFTATERKNLAVLISERTRRQNGAGDG